MGIFHHIGAGIAYMKNTLTNSALVGAITVYSLAGCCPNELPYVPEEVPPIIENVDPPAVEPPETPTCQSPSISLELVVDFYSAMKDANVFASLFSSEINGFTLDPDVADLNGPYDHSTETIVGNGILDINEFYLLSVVLSNPGLDLRPYGGIDYVTAAIAWNDNVARAKTDLGENATSLIKGSETVFPGYITLGDPDSTYLPKRLSELAAERMSRLGVQPIDLANYVTLQQFFSANGDADGDGTSNISEYNIAVASGIDYALLALDPCNP